MKEEVVVVVKMMEVEGTADQLPVQVETLVGSSYRVAYVVKDPGW